MSLKNKYRMREINFTFNESETAKESYQLEFRVYPLQRQLNRSHLLTEGIKLSVNLRELMGRTSLY